MKTITLNVQETTIWILDGILSINVPLMGKGKQGIFELKRIGGGRFKVLAQYEKLEDLVEGILVEFTYTGRTSTNYECIGRLKPLVRPKMETYQTQQINLCGLTK